MRTSRRMLGQARAPMAACLFLSGLITLLMLATPYVIVVLFQTVLPQGNLEVLAVLGLLAAGACVTGAVLETSQNVILLRTGLWLRHVLGEHIVATGFQSQISVAALRADQLALEGLSKALTGSAVASALRALWSIAFVAALYAIDTVFGLIGTGVALATVLAVVRAPRAMPAHDGTTAQDWLRQAAQSPIWYNRQSASVWERLNRGSIAATLKAATTCANLNSQCAALAAVSHLVLVCTGAHLIIANAIDVGHVLAASFLLLYLTTALSAFASALPELHAASAGYQHVFAKVSDIPAAAKLGSGPLELINVTVVYPGRTVAALSNASVAIEPGRCLVVTGERDSGKSTLLAALAGAVEPVTGAALIGGQPLSILQRTSSCPPVGYMPALAGLIDGTVDQNVSRFSTLTRMPVAAAALRAGVHDILAALPAGYETCVGSKGCLLSSREQAAVSLARALHSEPVALILDQPEKDLEDVCLARLFETLRAMKNEGVAIVLSTSHPGLATLADHTIVMSKGQILDADSAHWQAA